MRNFLICLIILILLNSSILSVYIITGGLNPSPINTFVQFNITYDDPMGDVYDPDQNHVSDHKDIDIIQLRSHKSNDNRYLILELKVAGKIKKSSNVEYYIYLEHYVNDDEYSVSWEEEYYNIECNNGVCIGVNQKNDQTESLNANIRNSNTLVIKVPLERSKDVDSFNLYAETHEETKTGYYYDSCDYLSWYSPYRTYEPFLITEPINGYTVSDNWSVKGIINYDHLCYEEIITSVEVQIDSESTSGWRLATPMEIDNWSTWSYQWDTKLVSDGKHMIYARAFNGKNYYFDRVTVNVSNHPLEKPKTADVPIYNIGDFYYYEGLGPFFYCHINDTIWGPYYEYGYAQGELTGLETIIINGTSYNGYKREFKIEYEYWDNEYESYIKSIFKQNSWWRKNDLAMLKVEHEYLEIDKNGDYVYDYSFTITYEYLNGNPKYPLNVGNKWKNKIIERDIRYNYTSEGKHEFDNYTHKYVIEHECMGTGIVTVPAGTFEVFIVLSYFNVSSYQLYEKNKFTGDYNSYKQFQDNYIVEYYSPDLGCLVKAHQGMKEDPLPYSSFQLVSYKYGNKSFKPKFEDYSDNLFDQDLSILIFPLISINIFLISIMYITSTEIGKFGFFSTLAPLFAKGKKKRNYELGFIKGSVRGVIYANPGENYSNIKKILNLTNGTLTYYLKSLEEEKMIISERDGFLKRFYPTIGRISKDILELTEIQKGIYKLIQKNPGISQKDISSKLEISLQRVNYHIQLLIDARIIKIMRDGKITKCFIIDEAL